MKRIVTIVGVAAALAVPSVASGGNTAIGAKPKPRCESTLIALGGRSSDRYGLQLYTWTECGLRVGIPFG